MIAHSFADPSFGPAQRLHGATYAVEIEVRAPSLNEHHVVMDIGALRLILRETLAAFDYTNLDDHPGVFPSEPRRRSASPRSSRARSRPPSPRCRTTASRPRARRCACCSASRRSRGRASSAHCENRLARVWRARQAHGRRHLRRDRRCRIRQCVTHRAGGAGIGPRSCADGSRGTDPTSSSATSSLPSRELARLLPRIGFARRVLLVHHLTCWETELPLGARRRRADRGVMLASMPPDFVIATSEISEGAARRHEGHRGRVDVVVPGSDQLPKLVRAPGDAFLFVGAVIPAEASPRASSPPSPTTRTLRVVGSLDRDPAYVASLPRRSRCALSR